MLKIAIIRESRSDDNRTPLVPLHIKELLNIYPKLKIVVQPSPHRCFLDKEYEKNGAILSEDIRDCDLILGVKEVEPNLLIELKKYMFFSHTSKIQTDNSEATQGTPGMDKRELLKEVLNKKITLIDYENIRDNLSRRYLGFGRFAGIIGCYNSLNLYLQKLGLETMPRAYKLNSYEKLKKEINNKDFKNVRIVLTGDGRVAKGALEILKYTNIKKISPEEYLINEDLTSVFCNLTTSKYVSNKKGKDFNLQHFINFPNHYSSELNKYMPNTDMIISSHYWDPKSPKLFEKKDLKFFKKLKVIGDITCDINGSIPTTLRSSTILKPYYYLDFETLKEINQNTNTLSIMAVDNLPSELPRDSSTEFSYGVIKEVLPYIIEHDDGRIIKATISKNGEFLPNYNYIKDYINS
tara:strand:- start:473 stop:1699 length:1227 start_codon:yes stop_codon:yes gene_type:complete